MSCFLTRFCTALPINSLMAFHSENYHNLPSCYICTTNMKAVVQIKWILFSPSVVDCIAKTCFAVLQCFDAVGWSEVQTCIWSSWCHCHSLSLASVKSRLVLPSWYRLTWVVPEKGPLNGCVWWVCVCFAVLIATYLVICPLVGWIRCASCCTVFVCQAKVTLNLGSISD